jgi:hypothetical protein
MTIRIDHVAGVFFIAFGLAIIAFSGDLPFGQLSMPGAGFLPMLVAVLTILFGAVLMLRARESAAFASIDWSDLRHAGPVILITAVAIALYTWLGFILTMILMMVGLIVLVERRNIVRAAIYSVVVVFVTYGVFVYAIKAPLPGGLFEF